MATLHVRSVPDELYERIHELARDSNRSVSAQVITLLDQAVLAQEARERQREALERIRRRRYVPPPGTPDSVELLREDRAR
jgi:hypothetical protein